jgi:hypothetical protein
MRIREVPWGCSCLGTSRPGYESVSVRFNLSYWDTKTVSPTLCYTGRPQEDRRARGAGEAGLLGGAVQMQIRWS